MEVKDTRKLRRRRRSRPEEQETPLPSLDEALAYIQEHRLFLHFDEMRDIDLWSPHHKVPISVRRSLRKHQVEVMSLLLAGDHRVCPAPDLHRRRSRARDRRAGRCTVCVQIISSMLNLSGQVERREELKAS
jgi:hypothetical protein